MSVSGREFTSFGRLQQSSHICVLERNPEAWSNTECRPDGLLKRPDGCKLEQFEASRTEEGPDENFSSSRQMMLWTAGRLDGCQGIEFSILQTVQNLLEALLNIDIHVKKHHYKEVILSNRMQSTTN